MVLHGVHMVTFRHSVVTPHARQLSKEISHDRDFKSLWEPYTYYCLYCLPFCKFFVSVNSLVTLANTAQWYMQQQM